MLNKKINQKNSSLKIQTNYWSWHTRTKRRKTVASAHVSLNITIKVNIEHNITLE